MKYFIYTTLEKDYHYLSLTKNHGLGTLIKTVKCEFAIPEGSNPNWFERPHQMHRLNNSCSLFKFPSRTHSNKKIAKRGISVGDIVKKINATLN